MAIQSDLGILYFATLIPVQLFYQELGQVEPEIWIQYWTGVLASQDLYTFTLAPLTKEQITQKLLAGNFFTVTTRDIEGSHIFYTSIKMIGDVYLSEIRFDVSFTRCAVTSKAGVAPLIPLVNLSIEQILKH